MLFCVIFSYKFTRFGTSRFSDCLSLSKIDRKCKDKDYEDSVVHDIRV